MRKIQLLLFVLLFGAPGIWAQAPGILAATKSAQVEALLQQAIGRRVAQQLLPPPLVPKTILRDEKKRVVLPRTVLNKHLHYLTQQQIPLEKLHRYVMQLQPHFDNQESFFESLAQTYYEQHFKTFTPHLDHLMQKVASLNDPVLEQRLLHRIEELAQYKDQILKHFPNLRSDYAIRIHYINDIKTLTAENFDEKEVMLSIEQHLRPSNQKTTFAHISGSSTFSVGKKGRSFRVYSYNGPTENLADLYRYLVQGLDTKTKTYWFLDTDSHALKVFNQDFSIALRITPHEYADPGRLHVHVYQQIKLDITIDGQTRPEPVLSNLSIPIKTPPHGYSLPQQELYRLFIEKPVSQMKHHPFAEVIIR